MSEENLSRIKKYGRRRQASSSNESPSSESLSTKTGSSSSTVQVNIHESDANVSDMQSRRDLYPSQRLKITRWFFNSLLFIFIVILFMLLWWGISVSPWGKVRMGS